MNIRNRQRQRGDSDTGCLTIFAAVALVMFALTLPVSHGSSPGEGADKLAPRTQWQLVGYDKPGEKSGDLTYRVDRTPVPGGWLYRTIPVWPDGTLDEGHVVSTSFVPDANAKLPAEKEQK